jgi:myo-inositol-1(or 4)-monophosphatase
VASYVETAVNAAREAGALLSDFYTQRVGYELKAEFDLVTDADRASEKLIVERLRAAYPSHGITAEEGGGQAGSSDYRWYVDPLDGTTNFAHGFPIFNVSIGLEHKGQLVAGVIYDPIRDEMFTAERGSGAFLNGTRIHVSQVSQLEASLVATGFPSRRRHESINVHFYYQLGMLSHGVRRAGAAATDLAYVACGRLEAFWEFGLKPWDMAAGMVLVEEAGGRLSDMKGNPVGLHSPHLLADNGSIHEEILSVFDGIFRNEIRFKMVEITR